MNIGLNESTDDEFTRCTYDDSIVYSTKDQSHSLILVSIA